jgi:hypothetical protein
MSTPQTRANTSAKNKTVGAEKMDKTPEKSKDTMVEVSKTLTLIQKDLADLKKDLKKTIKEDNLESLVSTIVRKILEQNNKEIKEESDKKFQELEKRHKVKIEKLEKGMEILEQRAEALAEKIVTNNKEMREIKQILQRTEYISKEALRLGNLNEQYSRKHNFKIIGVHEADRENTWKVVQDVLKTNAKVNLEDREIVAAHRIPGVKGKPRPIIVKVLNPNIKTRVMKKRSDVKRNGKGLKLVDDVTKKNSELITTLLNHEHIDSAWYFNGSVFAKLKGNDRRVKFDIFDDIDNKIRLSSK